MFLAINRKKPTGETSEGTPSFDGHYGSWGLPGAPGLRKIEAKLGNKKLFNEVCLHNPERVEVYKGYADSRSNTDNAWWETKAIWYPVTDEGHREQLDALTANSHGEMRWIRVSESCPEFRDLWCGAHKIYVMNVAAIQYQTEQMELVQRHFNTPARKREIEQDLMDVENTLRRDVTRSQVRAGFAVGVIPEDEVTRLQLVQTFALGRTGATMMHARLAALQKHESGMLAVERGMDKALSNGQIEELLKYYSKHDFRNSTHFGTRLVEILVNVFQLSVEQSEAIGEELSSAHKRIRDDYAKAIHGKSRGNIFAKDRAELYHHCVECTANCKFIQLKTPANMRSLISVSMRKHELAHNTKAHGCGMLRGSQDPERVAQPNEQQSSESDSA